jgi:hypothetical protein
MKLSDLKNIDVEATARAIEASEDGERIPGLRESLEQAKRGEIGRVTTPKQFASRLLLPI